MSLPIDYVHTKIDVDLDFVFVRILTKLFLTFKYNRFLKKIFPLGSKNHMQLYWSA